MKPALIAADIPPIRETAPAPPEARRDAKNLGNFFRPERLRIRGGNRHTQTLTLKVLEAQARVFQRQMHRPGKIFSARFARLAGLGAEAIGRRIANTNDCCFVCYAHDQSNCFQPDHRTALFSFQG
jgi:hypothetical protein